MFADLENKSNYFQTVTNIRTDEKRKLARKNYFEKWLE